jgi:hypothetical protein
VKKPSARNVRLLTLYGITEAEYASVLAAQGGVCPICLQPPKRIRLSVEHRHFDGLIRGICCWSCNNAIAYLRDDVARAKRLAEYLCDPPAAYVLGYVCGRVGRATRKWRTKRERRDRMVFVAARLVALGYLVPKRMIGYIKYDGARAAGDAGARARTRCARGLTSRRR